MEKRRRFFGGLLKSQENWLNAMAQKGFRLVETGKLTYVFEPCAPGEYQYRVEFVGEKSRESARDYAGFLEECGYRVFFKNINLNYSVGKVQWRPWAQSGGRLSTNRTTYNRELLLVEKRRDGKPFELHTTCEDRLNYGRSLRRPWLFFLVAAAALAVGLKSWVWGGVALVSLVILAVYQMELHKLKKQSDISE